MAFTLTTRGKTAAVLRYNIDTDAHQTTQPASQFLGNLGLKDNLHHILVKTPATFYDHHGIKYDQLVLETKNVEPELLAHPIL